MWGCSQRVDLKKWLIIWDLLYKLNHLISPLVSVETLVTSPSLYGHFSIDPDLPKNTALRLLLLKTPLGWTEKPKSLCSAFKGGGVEKAVDTNWCSGITVTLHRWSHDTELLTVKCQNYYVPGRFTVITITAVKLTQKSAPPPPQPLRPDSCSQNCRWAQAVSAL